MKNNLFAKEIITGLSSVQKAISSKYLYDEIGCEIFNKITGHPDYYLTACEIQILNTYKHELSQLTSGEAFNLVELGPGEGIKSKIIIQELIKSSCDFTYIPVDISKKYLVNLENKLIKEFSNLKIRSLELDYFMALNFLKINKHKNLILFLGSSIGNFSEEQTRDFLKKIKKAMNKKDFLLIGFDLKKEQDILMRAYSDDQNLTKKFNLNLLRRINKELGTNFDTDYFDHIAIYNKNIDAMESYLISLKNQEIYSNILARNFSFKKNEKIHVEFSHKYNLNKIKNFASNSGFKIIKNFFDKRAYFVNSLWCLK